MGFTEKHPIEEGFAEVFDAKIAPELERLEAMRLDASRTGQKRLAIATGVGVAIGGAIVVTTGSWVFAVILAVVGLIGGLAWRGAAVSGWKSAVGDVVMPPVLGFLGDLQYSRDVSTTEFPVGAMRDLGLFGSYNRATLNHKLWGQWKGTRYQMVQANLRHRSSSGRSNSSSSTKVVFQGLLFEIDVPAPAPCPILIAREYGKLGNQLAGFFAFGSRRGMPKVEFDHAAFEEVFEVHAEMPEAARDFMPPRFLDTLIEIGDREGGKAGAQSMTAGFQGDRFYLALAKGLGFVNVGSVGRSILDIEDALHALFDDIGTIRRIIDRLHGE